MVTMPELLACWAIWPSSDLMVECAVPLPCAVKEPKACTPTSIPPASLRVAVGAKVTTAPLQIMKVSHVSGDVRFSVPLTVMASVPSIIMWPTVKLLFRVAFEVNSAWPIGAAVGALPPTQLAGSDQFPAWPCPL